MGGEVGEEGGGEVIGGRELVGEGVWVLVGEQ